MNLNRQEMAIRKPYEQLVLNKTLTTVFRPGNRIYPNWRGYKKGEVITLRIVEKPGDDEREITPVFNENTLEQIQITEITCKPISTVTSEDFNGSSPDVQDIDSLTYHLGIIYNKNPQEINEITIIKYKYL